MKNSNFSPTFGDAMSRSCLLATVLFLAGCQPSGSEPDGAPRPEETRAREVIAEAIQAHGGDIFESGTFRFHFRGADFRVIREDGYFYQERVREVEGATITEAMTNSGTFRWVNGASVELGPDAERSLETAVNSVVYFAFLPYRLEDPAARPLHLGERELEGTSYDLVEVTFHQEGGGRDHDDRFLYWFHGADRTLDFLAYYYHTGESGSRFRKAIQRRTVDGMVVQDYENYSGEMQGEGLGMQELERYDDLYREGALELVSEVILEGVAKGPLPQLRPWDEVMAGRMPVPGPRWSGTDWRNPEGTGAGGGAP
ncbi:MAG: DUF6503 family protein [Gemmatimonadota bacterium]